MASAAGSCGTLANAALVIAFGGAFAALLIARLREVLEILSCRPVVTAALRDDEEPSAG